MKYIVLQRRYVLWPLIGLTLASLLAQFTSFNLTIANLLYDASRHRWLASDSWLTNYVIHDAGRDLIAFIFLAAVVVFLLGFIRPARFKKWQRFTAYLALCIALTTGLVGLGKKFSSVGCPWDLQQFGGTHPYTHLFSPNHKHDTSGHCFPGGHSSGAFSLYALYFIFLLLLPKHARKVLVAVTVLGLIYAVGQWTRGAHFMIHDIWSAAIGWYISLILSLLFFAQHPQQYKSVPVTKSRLN